MNFAEINHLRLHNHQVESSDYSTPKALLEWMGAMQAQDYEMAKWAVGVRLPDATREDIEDAIENIRIIRTHLLRPTWHFISAEHFPWLLELSRPRVMIAIRSRQKQLGLTDKVVSESNEVIEKTLAASQPLTRKELLDQLEETGFENKNNRISHLLLRAELDGIIGSGPSRGTQYTYKLMEGRLTEVSSFDKEEAQARLARLYFQSHGPATLKDFVWWSGLTKTRSRKAIEMLKPELMSEEIRDHKYWFFDESGQTIHNKQSVYLLPAYDEYVISYRNREMMINEEDEAKAISANGIFRPVIVVNGVVKGIWKRTVQSDSVEVKLEFFVNPGPEVVKKAAEQAERFAGFLGKKLDLAVD
ncbi:Winged helix DNA-binding domain-containing protein [Fodinibius roseus]|uniref:Winged helix DNA-binding domain-containing protein n=1 Tax=Fodinibius roseus TaxID=1194090 RepID=A0A1M5EQM5_9BACT|nr:winged helix DNA-binding domain-containing protein [Fodinibius roseus]SHF81444.1 Winged helix DNA-binding domain-containing protein [Fodinibius roseus]